MQLRLLLLIFHLTMDLLSKIERRLTVAERTAKKLTYKLQLVVQLHVRRLPRRLPTVFLVTVKPLYLPYKVLATIVTTTVGIIVKLAVMNVLR